MAMPEYVAILKPHIFLIENVPDLVRHWEGKTFPTVLAQLEPRVASSFDPKEAVSKGVEWLESNVIPGGC